MSTDQAQRNKGMQAEQLRMLYEQAPGALVGQLILVAFISYVLRSELPPGEVVAWAVAITGIAVLDFLGFVAIRLDPEPGEHYRRWHRLFSVSVVIVSLSWGLAFLYLMMRVGPDDQLFLALMLACMGGGSVAALSSRAGLLACNLILSMLPSVLWLLIQGTMLGMASAFALMALAIELWFGGRRIGDQIMESLELRFENEALVAELKRANISLREMSNTDSLTGLYNRRFFDQALEDEWARLHRDAGVISVILIDVDHFKKYNDTLGHQAGDEGLRSVADAIRDAVNRPADVVARYGGEEFVVLLPDTESAGARAVAERIRKNLAKRALSHPDPSSGGTLTLSMGVCSLHPADDRDAHELLVRADHALYRAKANGRDRIEFAATGGDTLRWSGSSFTQN